MIGVLTTSYPRGPDDGSGSFVRQRVRILQRQGHDVEIIAAGDPSWPGEDGLTRIGTFGLFFSGGAPEMLSDAAVGRRARSWLGALGFSLAMLGQVASRRGRWHKVESHWLVPCGLLACALLPGVAHRVHVHGGDFYLLARLPFGRSIARSICQTGPELVFASSHLCSAFTALLGQTPESLGARALIEAAPIDRSVFFPRDPEERSRLRAQLGLARATVLAAGRLVPIKGFDVLIAALAEIPQAQRPDLVLAGEGPELPRLARQAQASKVRVRFAGSLGQRELAQAMAAADLFVHPCRALSDGRSEGMPLVVREARAMGLPVIASASGGLRELRGHDGYTLVEPDNALALAGAMRKQLG